MPASSRRKGVKGEAEVAAIWRAAGFEVRGLEGAGDHLVICSPPLSTAPEHAAWAHKHRLRQNNAPVTIHSEVKRQERLQLPSWLRQAQAEAPGGSIPVVAFRQNRGEWYAALPLAALVELAG